MTVSNLMYFSAFQVTVQLCLLWFGAMLLTDCTEVEGTESGCIRLSANGQGI